MPPPPPLISPHGHSLSNAERDRYKHQESERLGCPRENRLNYFCRDTKSSPLETCTRAGIDVCQSCIDLIVAVAAFRDGGHEYRDHDHSVATRDICAEICSVVMANSDCRPSVSPRVQSSNIVVCIPEHSNVASTRVANYNTSLDFHSGCSGY